MTYSIESQLDINALLVTETKPHDVTLSTKCVQFPMERDFATVFHKDLRILTLWLTCVQPRTRCRMDEIWMAAALQSSAVKNIERLAFCRKRFPATPFLPVLAPRHLVYSRWLHCVQVLNFEGLTFGEQTCRHLQRSVRHLKSQRR